MVNPKEYCRENNIFFEDESEFLEPIFDYRKEERLPCDLIKKLVTLGFIKPTPIQAISIPIILEKKDFIGISKTGSGKTLAFLVPAMSYLEQVETISRQIHSPRMLVLSPTRELALQTYEVFKSFNLFQCICVYGGTHRSMQLSDLRKTKPPVIIGTPGRVNDFLESGVFDLIRCNFLVLDEADRMFDMGFYPQIKKIIDQCPPKDERQTLLFSATWTRKVQEMANPLLNKNRVLLSVGPLFSLNACSDVKQYLFYCREYEKKKILEKILKEFKGMKILVFTNTKIRCQTMCEYCNESGYPRSEYIHGDVSQDKREKVIREFNQGGLKVIFATDVASRGLDIKDITAVVNYDFPIDVETYVHRIGRSGRNGAKGLAFSFITDRLLENRHAHEKLIKVVQESGSSIPDNLELDRY